MIVTGKCDEQLWPKQGGRDISYIIERGHILPVILIWGRRMFMTSVLRLAIIAAIGSTTTAAYSADACWYRYEAAAEQLQDFQTMLMVGTLRCRISGHAGEANYNDFATRQHNVLGANAYVLKAHYLRESGIQAGRTAYDQNVTLLANKHAARLDDPSFCSTVAAYARMAASASSEDLLVLAQSVVEAPVSGPCRANGAYAEAVALPPPPAYAPSYEAAAPAVMPALYAPEPPRAEPAPLPEMAPPPIPVIAAAPPPPVAKASAKLASAEIVNAPVVPPIEAAPAASAATPEQALEAAITALQAATAALKARPAPIH